MLVYSDASIVEASFRKLWLTSRNWPFLKTKDLTWRKRSLFLCQCCQLLKSLPCSHSFEKVLFQSNFCSIVDVESRPWNGQKSWACNQKSVHISSRQSLIPRKKEACIKKGIRREKCWANFSDKVVLILPLEILPLYCTFSLVITLCKILEIILWYMSVRYFSNF